MNTFLNRVQAQKAVIEADRTPAPDAQRVLRRRNPASVRCACLNCGAHGFRVPGANGAGSLDRSVARAACSVCGASGLLPVPDDRPATSSDSPALKPLESRPGMLECSERG